MQNGTPQLEKIHEADIVLVQRDFCQYLASFEQILTLAHSLRKPVIFDIDDMLFELPENHPDRISHYYTSSLLPMLLAVMEVDLVTTSTTNLRDYLLPFNRKIRVLPNYLNDSLWQMKEAQPVQPDEKKIMIGYMGGASHKPDLQDVLPALLQIVDKYPGRIGFHFWGIQPPPELAAISQCDWFPPKSRHYADFARYFQTQSADIVISPLVDNYFNAYKSPIKFLEYSAIGAPGVYSRIKTYSDMITNGKEGLLAETTREWVDALSELVEKPALRTRLVQNAQQKIQQGWLLSKNVDKVKQTYDSAIPMPAETRDFPPFYSVIKSLAWQYYTEGQEKTHQVHTLSNQLESKTKSVHTLSIQVKEKDQALHILNDQLVRKDELMSELNDQLAEKEERIVSYKQQLIKKEQGFGALKNQLVEKDEDFSLIKDQLLEKTEVIRTLNNKLAEKDRSIRALSNQLELAEEEVISYAVSNSWKITRPLRKISQKFFKGKK